MKLRRPKERKQLRRPRPLLMAKRKLRRLDGEQVDHILRKIGYDPVAGMAMIAMGDVVKLGYMTEKELLEPATWCRGVIVRPSGRERALDYVSPTLRFQAMKELTNYVYAKRASMIIQGPTGESITASVVVQLPPNGREAPTE